MSENVTKGNTVERMIGRNDLRTLLDNESKRSNVFVPARTGTDVEFVQYGADTEPAFNFGPSRLSPKSFFFPQTETLYTFDFDTIEPQSLELPSQNKSTVLFGVRPCDAASFMLLDQVFGSENHGYDDPYYEGRRDATIVISLACNSPDPTCFCTSVGGDPSGERGADVIVFDLEDRLYLKSVTEKGEAFLARNDELLSDAKPDDRGAAESNVAAARESMTSVPYDRKSTKKRFDDDFEKPIWESITNTCIGCGACTYLCPTCHCFDISDEERHYKGKRIRTWDSCQYPLFTKHASGHNPRPAKTQRLRQRFMHKFSYTVETVNEVYCVGCGRCVKHCPVNLDIREVLQEFSST